MSTRTVMGSALAAAWLAVAAGAQQPGQGPGNPGNPSGSQPSQDAQPGTPQTPGVPQAPSSPQPSGSQPSGLPPAGPSNEQPGSGADLPGGPVDRGAPGQPGGAPSCPADNPACNPMNPASPTDSTRRQDGTQVTPQHRAGDTDGRLTSRVRESLLRGRATATLEGLTVSTAGGKVTLRGQVGSEQEKADLERRATAVAGQGNVVNELTVAP